MNRKSHELESTILAMVAAFPLYLTDAVSVVAVASFHLAMLGVLLWRKYNDRPLLPPVALNVAAVLYLLFVPVDAISISRSLIRASAHLLFFIIVYQSIEASLKRNSAQRLLVVFFIFVTSVATATHISVVLFIIVFAFLMYRQLMHISHEETALLVARPPSEAPSSRMAVSYLVPTLVIAAIFFPMLPRVRNPVVRGITGSLSGTSTGFSETIDFNERRQIVADPQVLARVWMSRDAMPFFSPIRLRGAVYDHYLSGRWRAGARVRRPVSSRDDVFRIAAPVGFSRTITVQQRLGFTRKLFIPSGTHSISGLAQLTEEPSYGAYTISSAAATGGLVTYQATVSRNVLDLEPRPLRRLRYPVTEEVRAMARNIVGNASSPMSAATRIEAYLSTNFEYVPDPSKLGDAFSVNEFLLRKRKGHCEYFAAGMVVLLTALDIPARIVGGFYGGELNPLTGYIVIRQRDAHAWVEMHDGEKWITFDPTPASLRPGASSTLFSSYLSAVSESVNYFWDRYILTFGLGDQITLIIETLERSRELGRAAKVSFAKGLRAARGGPGVLAVAILAALVMMTIAVRNYCRPLFEKLAVELQSRGIDIAPSTTAEEIANAVEQQKPALAEDVRTILEVYERDRFSAHPVPLESRLAATRALARLRRTE